MNYLRMVAQLRGYKLKNEFRYVEAFKKNGI